MDFYGGYLYIHVPFCKKICSYCDFYKSCNLNQNNNFLKYIENIINEFKQIKFQETLKTVYIGGGTPNFLNNKQLELLLKTIKKFINYKITEYTIELNPEFITKSQLLLLKKYNINRLSIGIQSTNNLILNKLNRFNGKNLENKILMANSIFSNISLDFIYNLPNQSILDIDADLNFIFKIKPNHISWYSLILKEGTPLYKEIKNLNLDNDYQFYLHILKKLTNIGYKQYEVSSFVNNNKNKSLHNLAYWNLKQWYGIGPSACGFFINHDTNQYFHQENSKSLPWNTKYILISEKEYCLEKIIMGLRIKEGIILNDSEKKLIEKYFEKAIKINIDKKFIIFKNNKMYCTNRGFLLLNDILEEFI